MVTAADTTPEHVQACQAAVGQKPVDSTNDGPFTPFTLSRRRCAAQVDDFVSRRNRRRQLGRDGHRSPHRLRVHELPRHVARAAGWRRRSPASTYSFDTRGVAAEATIAPASTASDRSTRVRRRCKDAERPRRCSSPCQRPPWARLIAVNANTGEIAWQTTLGTTEALPAGKQNTGGSGSAGPTATAGGLVFIGATNDRRFRAFDSDDRQGTVGRRSWTARPPPIRFRIRARTASNTSQSWRATRWLSSRSRRLLLAQVLSEVIGEDLDLLVVDLGAVLLHRHDDVAPLRSV